MQDTSLVEVFEEMRYLLFMFLDGVESHVFMILIGTAIVITGMRMRKNGRNNETRR